MERWSGYRSSDAARRQIAVIAGAQYGVITTLQLRALGFSSQTIARLTANGHLHRLHRGVYAVGHTALTLSQDLKRGGYSYTPSPYAPSVIAGQPAAPPPNGPGTMAPIND